MNLGETPTLDNPYSIPKYDKKLWNCLHWPHIENLQLVYEQEIFARVLSNIRNFCWIVVIWEYDLHFKIFSTYRRNWCLSYTVHCFNVFQIDAVRKYQLIGASTVIDQRTCDNWRFACGLMQIWIPFWCKLRFFRTNNRSDQSYLTSCRCMVAKSWSYMQRERGVTAHNFTVPRLPKSSSHKSSDGGLAVIVESKTLNSKMQANDIL